MRLLRQPTLVLNSALAVLALAGAGWAYVALTGSDIQSPTSTAEGSRTVSVTQGDVTATVSASGTIESATTANANFVTSGTVTEIDVVVGDVVTEGQLLATVDPTDAQNELATAEANLAAAEAALTRAESNDSDDATIASAEAEVTSAETEVDSAQRAVDGTALYAPIAGTVTEVNGSVGSSASSSGSSGGSEGSGGGSTGSSSSSSSSGFITIADLTSLQVSASFAETDATQLESGMAATVTWDALEDTSTTGSVASISPTATTSNNVNTYAVVTYLDSAPDGSRLGQSVTIVVTVASATDVIRIPSAALTSSDSSSTVQVETDTGSETRRVEVGVEGDTYVEITSGLSVGDQVVISVSVSSSSTDDSDSGSGGMGDMGDMGNMGGGGMPGGGMGGGQ